MNMSNDLHQPSDTGRAWVEINLGAIANNARELGALLHKDCEFMAVVKANAYGHGDEKVALHLQSEGVKAFGVATLGEAIRIRKAGVTGEILIFGYTHPDDAWLLNQFSLTQVVLNGAHAQALNATGQKINVHIGVDSGMHRVGIAPSSAAEFESVYKCENLTVTGMGTHCSSSDGRDESDIAFTKRQIEQFNAAVDLVKSMGYNPGKVHFQASFGIVNYPGLPYDYARAGIMLYGVKSDNVDIATNPNLIPAMAIKARIAQVHWIEAGEGVSYGRSYYTDKRTKLATLAIGYADGIPRQMSGNGGLCIVHGQKAPIVGRICMDMLMVDVTNIENVAAGDVVTLLGKDGGEEIRCEDFSEASNSITDDILSRIGTRLPKVYV